MSRYITALVFVAVLAVGCFGGGPQGPPAGRREGNLVIQIDWMHFDAPQAMAAMTLSTPSNDDPEPTHVGARLVYPNDGAVFTQSKRREQAEQDGVISMRVPAASLANLFVVAVHEGDGTLRSGQVVQFGVLPNLVIAEDTTLVIGMDEISWTSPTWTFSDGEHEADIASRWIDANKDHTVLNIGIVVGDPFQAGEQLDYSNLLIGVAGTNSTAGLGPTDAAANFRQFNVACKNPNAGSANDSLCWFGPYLKGDRFNLPSGYYLPPILDDFVVSWQ